MKIYHSTGIKNANKIIKTSNIKSYCFFAYSIKESMYYGSMYGNSKTIEIETDDYPKGTFIFGEYIQNIVAIDKFKVLSQIERKKLKNQIK
jgi:hypothetical protein